MSFNSSSSANGHNAAFPSLGGNSPVAATSSSSGSGLSAAQRLQQAHAGVDSDPFPVNSEDPFPVANQDSAKQSSLSGSRPAKLDVSDEQAFPTLGGSGAGNAKAQGGPTWGSAGQGLASRLKQQQQQQQQQQQSSLSAASQPISRPDTPSSAFNAGDDSGARTVGNATSATVQLATSDIHIQPFAGARQSRSSTFSNDRQAEPTTLGEVIKLLAKRHPNTTVEASTGRQNTTFIIKGKGANAEDDIAKVKRELLARLAKKIQVTVEVPASLRGFIVGAKGRTLKSIQDTTGAHIQLPARDEIDSTEATDSPQPAQGQNDDDSQDGPAISIVLSGDSNAVNEARSKILAIVSERAAKSSSRVDVPREFWALLNGARGARIAEIVGNAGVDADKVSVFIPRTYERRGVPVGGEAEEEEQFQRHSQQEKSVTVSGDRDSVQAVVLAIQHEVSELKRLTKTASIGVNKRQHRFLIGSAADDILEATGCAVEVPAIDDPSENVTIRGTQADIIKAFGLVMDKANATPVDTLDLMTAHAGSHDRKQYASSLARYVVRRAKFRQLAEDNRVNVYLPRQAAIDGDLPALIEIVGKNGEPSDLGSARQAIISIVRKLPPSHFAVVDVDSLIHRHLIGKKGSRIKAFEEKRNVEVVFPPQTEDGEDRSDIVLVFTGEGEAKQVLEEVKAEILSMAKEAADITTATLTIPAQLHRNIIGQGGTTLNAVIGEEKLVNVSFGSKPRGSDSKANVNAGSSEDSVVIRGPSEEVARVRKALEEIAEAAKNEEIVNSHIVEFEIESIHVRHVVGKAGAGITKLREELGVRVEFEEPAPGAATGAAAKKKTAGGKSKVMIKGRKENAEEAKKRILTKVTQIADEVTLTVPLPASLERGSLIGKQGTYLKRLEDKYEVRINFPRDGRKGDNGDDDDSPRPSASSSNEITIRGPKKGADAAKGELVALIAYEQENGNVVTFTVSTRALPRILGKGGASVNQIKDDTGVGSVDVDQESDSAPTSTITVRGTKSATKKAQDAILAIAKEVDNEARFVVTIPKEYHTTLIGSGGSTIRELIANAGGPVDGRASGNTVRFPRQGDATDEVVITAPKAVAEKIRDALEKEVASLKSRIVYGVAVPQSQHASIIGKGASAIQELQRKHGVKVTMPSWNEYAQAGEIVNPEDVADAPAGDIIKVVGPKEAAVAAAADLAKGRAAKASATETVQVPRKLHAKVAQGGRFFRSLPSGTRVTHGSVKPPSSNVKSKKPPVSTTGSGASTPGPRIDDDDQAASNGDAAAVEFQLVPLYDDDEQQDGEDIPWVIQSTSQEDTAKVAADIKKALELAQSATHVAWVTVPRGAMARIVGRGGSGLDQLRSHGVEVEVVGKRDSNQLTLTGTPAAIDAAHQQIVRQAAPRPPRQQRNYDDEDRY